jgi:hypothetical protein
VAGPHHNRSPCGPWLEEAERHLLVRQKWFLSDLGLEGLCVDREGPREGRV